MIAPFVLAAILAGTWPVTAAGGSHMRVPPVRQTEKESRTPAQQKINSQVLYEIYRRQGKAAEKHVPPGKTGVKLDARHRALVDVRAEVTPDLLKTLASLGATIVSTSPEYRSIIAWVPLLKLERLAEYPAVRAIEPPAEAITARPSCP